MAAPKREDWRRIAITAGVILAVALAVYLAATWQERGRASATVAELEQRITALEADRDSTAADLSTAEARIQLLRARALLFETALDLERRNFGVANERLDAASERLASVDAGAAGISEPQLEALRSQIAEADLRVAEDLAGQREQILGYARQLEEMMPEGSPAEEQADTEAEAVAPPDEQTT